MNKFEIKKDGLYINGAKVTAYRNLKIESDISQCMVNFVESMMLIATIFVSQIYK